MKLSLFIILNLLHNCISFTPGATGNGKPSSLKSDTIDRKGFLTSVITVGIISSSALLPNEPAVARGRATLEYALDRYYPRIEAGGVFYATDLKKAIEKNDWQAIKVRLLIPTMKLF